MSWIGWVVIGILAFNVIFFGTLGVVAIWATWRRQNR